jgi:hypothetical protein
MRRYLIILLTLITTGIHIYFYTEGNGLVFSGPFIIFTFFLLNALGYLVLLGLLYLPLGLPASLYRLVRPVFIGYTILTFLLYFIINIFQGVWSIPLAPIAKIDEVILVWQLWAEGREATPVTTQQKSETML